MRGSAVSGRSSGEPASAAGKRLFWICLLLFTYGSLYPFHYVEPTALGEVWRAFLSDRRLFSSRGDVVGNLVIGIPLGVFVSALPSPGPHRRIRLGLAVSACMLFTFALQALQIFFPPRVP